MYISGFVGEPGYLFCDHFTGHVFCLEYDSWNEKYHISQITKDGANKYKREKFLDGFKKEDIGDNFLVISNNQIA